MQCHVNREFGRVFNIDGERATAYLLEGKEALVQTHPKGVYEIARIGSYVIIPVGPDRLVGLVTKLRVEEHENLISRQKISSILPEAWRLLDFTLVGTLRVKGRSSDGKILLEFERGVRSYPTIESPVCFITEEELDAVFSLTKGSNQLNIASLSTDEQIPVILDINKMFGKHLAILGSTGTGKSCTVACIIHDLLNKKATAKDDDDYIKKTGILILDINGEYSKAFKDYPNARTIVIQQADASDVGSLQIPYWFFNFSEMCHLFTPSEQAQKPVLRNAIRYLRWKEKYDEACSDMDPSQEKFEKSYALLQSLYTSDDVPRLDDLSKKYNIHTLPELLLDFGIRQKPPVNRGAKPSYYRDGRHADNMSTLIERVRSIITEPDYKVIFQDTSFTKSYEDVRKIILGYDTNDNEQQVKKYDLVILDLSLLPYDLLQTITSFIGRTIFSYFTAMPTERRREYPFILVLEEAHNYLPRQDIEGKAINLPYERIAKEGRKYGLGLVIASQRPGELSETALSQCNTLIVHRLINPIDKNIVRSAVSVVDEDALKLLPSLGPRQAVVLGEGVNIPARVTIKELKEEIRPHSENPLFIGIKKK